MMSYLEKGACFAFTAPSRGYESIKDSWSEVGEDPLKIAFRHLALKQQADGSFADDPGEDLCKRVKNTALSLLAFSWGPQK